MESQNPDMVEYLLRAGANPEARMYVGYTPMYSAMHRPDQKIPQLLREFGSEEPGSDSEESLDSNSEVSPSDPPPPHQLILSTQGCSSARDPTSGEAAFIDLGK